VKPDDNSFRVHPQLSNKLAMDGVLVACWFTLLYTLYKALPMFLKCGGPILNEG
jgi:hypothetical protein